MRSPPLLAWTDSNRWNPNTRRIWWIRWHTGKGSVTQNFPFPTADPILHREPPSQAPLLGARPHPNLWRTRRHGHPGLGCSHPRPCAGLHPRAMAALRGGGQRAFRRFPPDPAATCLPFSSMAMAKGAASSEWKTTRRDSPEVEEAGSLPISGVLPHPSGFSSPWAGGSGNRRLRWGPHLAAAAQEAARLCRLRRARLRHRRQSFASRLVRKMGV